MSGRARPVSTALPDEEVVVEANPMLPAAVGELVSNAIEHNDTEDPVVDIEILPSARPPGTVELRIGDNGPGIPRSQLTPLREG